jgi:uncharacterized iron-regulated protein
MHEVQLEVIRGLYELDKNISIGLEMFPVTDQEVLNKWSLGLLTETEFIREAQWYLTWNFNFGFYEKIFTFAKDRRIPIYALNVPRHLISTIRMKGWSALGEEEKKMVPEPELTNEDHRHLIRTIFESTDLPHQMKGPGLDMVFEGLYRAQAAWDEAMARHARMAAEKDGRQMVVLAGSGHLLYNLGISRRSYEQNGSPYKTLVCVTVPQGTEELIVSRSLADYVWGLPVEARPAYPSVGLAFKKVDNLENIVIERDPIDGEAKGQDFKKGDIVLSVDGESYTDINELRIHLARYGWGDRTIFRILREGDELDVGLEFKQSGLE